MSKQEELEMQPWYFGFLSRDHIVSHLSKPGDWCVRSSGSNEERVLYVITRFDAINVHEFKLLYKENEKRWTLVDTKGQEVIDENAGSYGSVVELLSTDSDVTQKINLRNPITRPQYLIDDENLKLSDTKLGKGHYAEVIKGTLKLNGQEISVAVKRSLQMDTAVSLSDKRPTKEIIKAKLAKSQMIAEARLVYGFVHENIIKMYGVACNFSPVKIVMEYCPGGSLRNLLIEKKELIKAVERNIFLFEAAKALRHLQLRKCVHRWDVAARNCLIGKGGSLKLSDFGLSKLAEELKRVKNDEENIAWPIPWMAPETLSKKPKFTTKSDVYAFGVLIYEVYSCGGKPWPNIKSAEEIIPIVRKGKMMETPPLMDEKNVENIMRDCWKRKAIDRPDFIELVKRFRVILKNQKIPNGAERVVSMLKGVDSSTSVVKLEEDSPDSAMSKQRELDDKGAQKMIENIEEASVSTFVTGETRASAPALQAYKPEKPMRTAAEKVIKPAKPRKFNFSFRFPHHRKRVVHSTPDLDVSQKKSMDSLWKWSHPKLSSKSKHRARRARYKSRKKSKRKTSPTGATVSEDTTLSTTHQVARVESCPTQTDDNKEKH